MAGQSARHDFGVEGRCLVGRIEGAILTIHKLEQAVARSGLVDFDEIVVSYA